MIRRSSDQAKDHEPADEMKFITPAELAAEEAALREIERRGPVADLPPELVDRLVARAIVPAERGRRWRQPLLAALLLLSVTALGWVGARHLWWQQKDSVFTLDFATSLLVAVEPERMDSAYLSALGRLAEHCEHGAMTLRLVQQSGAPPQVVAAASTIAAACRRQLTAGVGAAPGSGPTGDLVAIAARVVDSKASESERLAALHELGELMQRGIAAMLASPLQSETARQQRSIWLQRLTQRLAHPGG